MGKEIIFMQTINQETISSLIEQCSKEKEISILLSSDGGNPSAAVAFNNFIKEKGINLKVTVIGNCDSSAMIILCAARVRRAYHNSTFLLHLLRRSFIEEKEFSSKDLFAEAADIKSVEKKYRQIIAKVTKRPLKELNKYFDEEKSLNANQAFKLGLLTVRPL